MTRGRERGTQGRERERPLLDEVCRSVSVSEADGMDREVTRTCLYLTAPGMMCRSNGADPVAGIKIKCAGRRGEGSKRRERTIKERIAVCGLDGANLGDAAH